MRFFPQVENTLRVAAQLGRGAADFAVHVKGLEIPMHDPRAFFSWAVNYATSPRGGCHLHGMSGWYENRQDPCPEWGLTGYYPRHSNEGKAAITRVAQNWAHIVDSMVICYFAGFTLKPSDLAALINHATGSELTPQDLFTIGDRINALHRAHNYRCGIRRADDWLPVRSLTQLAEGGAAGKVPDLAQQLDEYYHLRRWEPDGKPSRPSLHAWRCPRAASGPAEAATWKIAGTAASRGLASRIVVVPPGCTPDCCAGSR